MKLTQAQIIDAWIEDSGAKPGTTDKPPVDKKTGESKANAEEPNPAGGSATSDDSATSDEEEEGPKSDDEADPNSKRGAAHGGQLQGLIAAVLELPEEEREESAPYKRMTEILGEPAQLKQQLREEREKRDGPPVMVQKASASDPLADVASDSQLSERIEQLETQAQNAQAWIDWCGDNKEGGTPPNGKELDAEAVKETLTQARTALRDINHLLTKQVPLKQDWLKKLGETRAALRKSQPELFQKDSPLLAECVKLLEEGRVSPSHPDYMQDALDLVEGRRARQERESGKVSITLDPKAAAAKASSAAAPGGKGSAAQRPGPSGQAGSGKTPGARSASAGPDLATAKAAAKNGDPKAQAVLLDAFASQ